MILYIRCKSGMQYDILEDGSIKRLDQVGFMPSGQWKMRGIRHVRLRKAYTLSELRRAYCGSTVMPTDKPTLLYKNGKPQYYIADTDHGTNRIMCDGILHIGIEG